jgi:hypothetical protein
MNAVIPLIWIFSAGGRNTAVLHRNSAWSPPAFVAK